jgi:hypothetical protein
MENRSHKLRRSLLVAILLVMFLPLIQLEFLHIPFPPLKGAIEKVNDPHFSIDHWFSETFQIQQDQYNNLNFGFHDVMVRLYNQFLYAAYRKAGAKNVVIGKEDYLYEENYIKGYYGTDFTSVDSIGKRMEMARYVQDTLAKLNKTLLFIFAPGKAYYYPSNIPERYNMRKGMTNYSQYVKMAKELGINYIDFNDYFIRQKPSTPYPLVPKYGIHWSYYGMCLAADSMIRTIEHLRNIDMPGIYWSSIERKVAQNEDYDIGNGLNLLYPLVKDTLAYPLIHFEAPEGKTQPSPLIISDSFYFVMYRAGLSSVFKHPHFCYYYKEVYEPEKPVRNMIDVDLKRELNNHDLFIVMGSTATLPDLGWGFIEDSYHLYHDHFYIPGRDSAFNAEVVKLMNYIRTDKNWMKGIREKALEKKIPLDSALRLDAIYQVEEELRK